MQRISPPPPFSIHAAAQSDTVRMPTPYPTLPSPPLPFPFLSFSFLSFPLKPLFEPTTVFTRYHSHSPSVPPHPPHPDPPRRPPPSSQTPPSAASISTPCSADRRAPRALISPCYVSCTQPRDKSARKLPLCFSFNARLLKKKRKKRVRAGKKPLVPSFSGTSIP